MAIGARFNFFVVRAIWAGTLARIAYAFMRMVLATARDDVLLNRDRLLTTHG